MPCFENHKSVDKQGSAKYISYSMFDNEHPMYAIIDGDGVAHSFRSRNADGSVCDNSQVSTRNLNCGANGGSWGYEQVGTAIPALLATLKDAQEAGTGTGSEESPEVETYIPTEAVCAPGMGHNAVGDVDAPVTMVPMQAHVLLGPNDGAAMADDQPPLSAPTALAWHPDDPTQLWVSNRGTDDFTVSALFLKLWA